MINRYDNNISIDLLKQMCKLIIGNSQNKMQTDLDTSFNKWVNCIRNENRYKIITYSVNNEIVAFLNYSTLKNKSWISEVQILSAYQGTGILKKILKEYVSSPNLKEDIYIHINNHNLKSQGVFKHIGFKPCDKTIYVIKTLELIKWINND